MCLKFCEILVIRLIVGVRLAFDITSVELGLGLRLAYHRTQAAHTLSFARTGLSRARVKAMVGV